MSFPTDRLQHKPVTKAQCTYKTVSSKMALQIWQAYTHKHLERSNSPDLLFRLRLAHTLSLQLKDVFFSQQHKLPHTDAMEWLVLKVLNDRHPHHWYITR